jgi:hypothetical protein
VRQVTVDELAARYGTPTVVLVDVEGSEAHVLEGARRTLRAAGTDFLVEVHDEPTLSRLGSTIDDIIDRFDPTYYVLLAAQAAMGPVNTEFVDASDFDLSHGDRFFLAALVRSKS